MNFPRASGLLLHLTSLPGPHGIGDLGAEAYRFVDFLVAHQQRHWQILPLSPTAASGADYSPYVGLSAFAGNPLLISLDALVEDGFLPADALRTLPPLPEGVTDFPQASARKLPLLRLAAERFAANAADHWRTAFGQFAARERWWLDEFALFMALHEKFQEAPWLSWDPDLARRDPVTLQHWRSQLEHDLLFHQHVQFFFFTQWARLKAYANQRGVSIIGDVAIYVNFDSAEVWAHPELFDLDPETRRPRFVSGVPPDAFSATGQLWGNPLYRWKDDNGQPVTAVYDWWVQRFRSTLALVDILRIDHFRGFEAYWSVPAEETTAINGQWIKGPDASLFIAVQNALEDLPFIAEDLGVITPEVDALRLRFGFPGMKVLQFAFDSDAHNPYLPHTYTDPRCVAYPGTHDNDTLLGWYRSVTPEIRAAVLRYLGRQEGTEVHWDMIRLALSSVGALAIIPAQDLLGLGSEGRMNTPGLARGNWRWRLSPGALTQGIGARLAEMTRLYGRNT